MVGYLSEARCRLIAYGPDDVAASQTPSHLNPDCFHLSGTGLPRSEKEAVKRV